MVRSDRLLGIVLALQAASWQRAVDLAGRFGVSLRTIYRDMDALVEAGVPVVAVPGKGYRLNEGYFLPPLTLTTDEAVLLLLGADLAAEQFDVGYRAAAVSARKKLEGILPDRLRGEVAALQNTLRFVPVNAFDRPGEQAALPQLREALGGQRTVRFRYLAGGAEAGTEQTVHPYGLVHLAGAWHLVGYGREAGRVQHFRLDRMQGLAVLAETFERPAGYRLQRVVPEAPRDVLVRVRFDAQVARWVREAPSLYTVEAEEQAGALLVTLRVRRETEVLPWLLSWGAHAHVLEPASLRRRLALEADRIAARYAAGLVLIA
jgi:predicted DNA-binding transcriptional regulator YafY